MKIKQHHILFTVNNTTKWQQQLKSTKKNTKHDIMVSHDNAFILIFFTQHYSIYFITENVFLIRKKFVVCVRRKYRFFCSIGLYLSALNSKQFEWKIFTPFLKTVYNCFIISTRNHSTKWISLIEFILKNVVQLLGYLIS